MRTKPRRFRSTIRRRLKAAADAVLGRIFVLLIRGIRLIDRRPMANLAARVTRTAGPWLKEHRIGRENLAGGVPGKVFGRDRGDPHRGLGQSRARAAEFAHIDRLHILDVDRPGPEDIIYDQQTYDIFHRLRLDGKPGLIFTAHLANWELSAYVAAVYKLHLHVLYRRPNIRVVDDAVREARAGIMGTLVPTGLDAPVKLLRVLEQGGHVAMLVDQHHVGGVDVTCFGRRCKANPLIAQLARHVECPIHGARMVRLPGLDRFRIDLTEEIAPARDADGKVDVAGTMQVITSVVEGWVREYPEQWLWLHRRWR